MKWNKKTIFSTFSLGLIILLLSQCITKEEKPDPRGDVYAGAATCQQCHKAIYDQYLNTTHFQTSQPATKENILGSFTEGLNMFKYTSGSTIHMEDRDSGYYQVVYDKGQKSEEHRMDILFGKKHAQTFLFWKGKHTFEFPVSYYRSANGWGTSPGFTSTVPYFNREINIKCYECHASYVNSTMRMSANGVEEMLEKQTIIYGIDCERCHGPGINHVHFHQAYPDEKKAHYMTPVQSLQRQQRLDVCAVCHSGNDKIKERLTFRFKPGDTLANYYSIWQSSSNKNAEPDVHGNQYQLLSESKCFQKSITMDCSTCHNPHADAGKNLEIYSAACMNCHKPATHPAIKEQTALTLQTNCIDCHMPLQSSRVIRFQTAGDAAMSPYKLRTHRIAVY